ncbi:DEAD/DEAH box helicase [bacterium]|nr:DEAD/DEAH box helicase [bacterium]
MNRLFDLLNGKFDNQNVFAALKEAGRSMHSDSGKKDVRQLCLYLLENKDQLSEEMTSILMSLLNELGYYPYLADLDKGFREALNFEFHRSRYLNDFVFHSEQFIASEFLETGKSVILSAPTSFGKSLLIEEIVASRKFNNIVIIEPTLALIDEFRSKLKKYEEEYKIVFSKSQSLGKKNVFLLTQERLVDFENLPEIDFFVIDEFYKLSMESDERSNILNHAFYMLLKKTNRFYLLGPPVESIPVDFITKYDCEFISTDFETVNIKAHYVGSREFKKLSPLLNQFTLPTLIYSKGPGAAEQYANKYVDIIVENGALDTNEHTDLIEWIEKNVHAEWSLAKLLKYRVGFHHGGLPRHIGKYLVDAFNSGKIDYLFCTTTLIEGINTSAKNVVIYDKEKGRTPLNSFDVKNIAGRAGRMGTYLTGDVYIFGDEIPKTDVFVDFPWFSQNLAADELLVQIEPEDLKEVPKKKIEPIVNNKSLDLEIIKDNSNISPRGQIALARHLKAKPELSDELKWTGPPTYSQLRLACNLIWDFLVYRREGQNEVDGVVSGAQLTLVINWYRTVKSSQELIQKIISKGNVKPNAAVRKCMKFIKKWYEFRFPKVLMTLDSIQRATYEPLGLPVGNYAFFAGQVESGFIPESYAALKELGIPFELLKKLDDFYKDKATEDIDSLIKRIRSLDTKPRGFDNYEIELLKKL